MDTFVSPLLSCIDLSDAKRRDFLDADESHHGYNLNTGVHQLFVVSLFIHSNTVYSVQDGEDPEGMRVLGLLFSTTGGNRRGFTYAYESCIRIRRTHLEAREAATELILDYM